MAERISRRTVIEKGLQKGAGVLAALSVPLVPNIAHAAPPPLETSAPKSNLDDEGLVVYYPETGHHLAGGFLDFWRRHRNGALLGLPITEEIDNPDGTRIQYFENVALEYNPAELASPIRLASLGEQQVPQGADFSTVPVTLFLPGQFWQKHGGDEFFGPPVSPVIVNPRSGEGIMPTDKKTYLDAVFSNFTQYTKKLAFFRQTSIDVQPPFAGMEGSYSHYLVQRYLKHLTESVWPGEIELVPLGKEVTAVKAINTDTIDPHSSAIIYSSDLWDKSKKIRVDLATQTLHAFEGDLPVMRALVSSGKEGYSTVVGQFEILKKTAGIDLCYPFAESPFFQPQGPFNMFFHR